MSGNGGVDGITYGRWINNVTGDQISETRSNRIDGSWLNNGDYDRAFKGFPMSKQINIFMGNSFAEPSWKSTFLTGGISLGIQGLGLWFMSKLGRNRGVQAPAAQNTGLQPNYFQNYFAGYKNFFTASGTPAPGSTVSDDKKVGDKKVGDKGGTGGADGADNTEKPDGTKKVGDKGGDDKVARANAINQNLKNQPIQGEVTEIGKNNKEGYPESFSVTDTTISKEKPNIYKFVFNGFKDESKKTGPKYKLESIDYHSEKDKSKDINLNEYVVTAGLEKGEEGKDGAIKGQIEMYTESNASAMANQNETGKGPERHHPPKKAS